MEEIVLCLKNGKIGFVHTESANFLLKLGKAEINRLSNVEFNNDTQLWEVIYKGEILASKPTRKEAIKWEIDYFNNLIMEGNMF